MGDAAGVGPEVLIKTLAQKDLYEICRPLVLGDSGILQRTVDTLGLSLTIHSLDKDQEPAGHPGVIDLLPLSGLDNEEVVPGRPHVEAGRAAAKYIQTGAELALENKIQALVTAPISKETLNLAGFHYQGHTEMLADLAGGARVAMMLAGDRLRVVLVTTHLALAEVPGRINGEGIIVTCEIADRSLRRYFGLAAPRLAVAALNPHAGEGGLFGREEEEIISPAISEARARGLEVSGPYPSDSLFYRAYEKKEFDAVVCMYHDQALIPFKLVHFQDGVNVTLGLPFIRTSADHGTAYDIAGQGRADHRSMYSACLMAARMIADANPAFF